jgi:hypothetical protein
MLNQSLKPCPHLAHILEAPEYESVESFVQYMMDDEREEFELQDVEALAYNLRTSNPVIIRQLCSFGLKQKARPSDKGVRGFNSRDNNRFDNFV